MLFELLKGQNYAVWASLVARRERIRLSCQSCRGLGQISVGLEDLLDEGMATQSSIFVWRIPWTEEPERRVLRVAAGHDWSNLACMLTLCNLFPFLAQNNFLTQVPRYCWSVMGILILQHSTTNYHNPKWLYDKANHFAHSCFKVYWGSQTYLR